MDKMGCWVKDSLPSFAKNLHILLVDYDSISLKHLASLLEQQSYNVSTTQLARVALSMIQEKGGRFDLVMANISMPDMDSFSFLHVLLEMNIAVIFMSSGMNLNIATKALAEGACYFLQKPISKDDLKYVWQHVYRIRNSNSNKITSNNHNYQLLMNCCYKDQKENNIMMNNDKQNFGENNGLIMDNEDHERRKKYYFFGKGSRSRVVWNSERRRKFTDALSKLGDQSRPKLILKLMDEPCLTVRQVANHLQKYKAQVEGFKMKRENKVAYKREMKIPTNEGLMRERFRLIAPKSTLVDPKLPVDHVGTNFVNQNSQQFDPNYVYNYCKEEVRGFETLSHDEFFNQFSNETHRDHDQEIDYDYLSGLNIDQIMQEQEGILEQLLPVEAEAASSGNEGKQLALALAEYDYIFNLLDQDNNDPYSNLVGDDINPSQVDQYSEWLRETALENRTGPENFLLGNTQQNLVGDVMWTRMR